MDLIRLDRSDSAYPTALNQYLGKDAPFSVAALADRVFIPYARPSSKTEQFCSEILAWQKPVYTFRYAPNESLITLGAKPLTASEDAQIGLGVDKRSED